MSRSLSWWLGLCLIYFSFTLCSCSFHASNCHENHAICTPSALQSCIFYANVHGQCTTHFFELLWQFLALFSFSCFCSIHSMFTRFFILNKSCKFYSTTQNLSFRLESCRNCQSRLPSDSWHFHPALCVYSTQLQCIIQLAVIIQNNPHWLDSTQPVPSNICLVPSCIGAILLFLPAVLSSTLYIITIFTRIPASLNSWTSHTSFSCSLPTLLAVIDY